MKVWNDCNPALSRGIKRVVAAVRRYAPQDVVFVDDRRAADLIIDHVVDGDHLLWPANPRAKRVAWQYVYSTSAVRDWPAVWADMDLVASYLDLPTAKLYRTPLGVDPAVFYPTTEPKRYGILATGYVAETECIREAYEACVRHDVDFCHVGPDFQWGAHYCHFEGISDDEMRRLYNQSHLALATRRIEGFELSALEALACGTMPVRLDLPCYRAWPMACHWLDPEGVAAARDLAEMLDWRMAVVAQHRPDEDRDWRQSLAQGLDRRYHWESVMCGFWRRVLAL